MPAPVAGIHVFLTLLQRARRGWPGRCPAMTWIGTGHLLRRHLLALEVAEARPIGLPVQELLHAFLAAVLLVHVLQGVALGVERVGRLRLVHEAHGADRLLG